MKKPFLLTMLAVILLLFVVAVAFAQEDGQPGTLAMTLDFVAVDGVMVPVQSGAPLPDFELQNHEALTLAGPWKKQRQHLDHDLSFNVRDAATIANLETEAGGRQAPGFDDSSWINHRLPLVENHMPGDESEMPEPYHDGVWYRRVVSIPAAWQGRSNFFVCLAANYIFDLWVNGRWVGVHEGGYTPFAFDLSRYLQYGADNLFAIRVDKPFPGVRQDQVPAWFSIDWWDYAGVIQDLYLESMDPVHVVRTNVAPTDYNGGIHVEVVMANDSDEQHDVLLDLAAFHADPNSPSYLTDPHPAAIAGDEATIEGDPQAALTIPAGQVRAASFDLRVRAPLRWTPKKPHLYVMKTTLSAGGDLVDEHFNQFGLRTVDRANGKLLLNGRVAFFPGVARHEDSPDTGRTMSWDHIRRDLVIIKNDLHALFLRTGHYPNNIRTYTLTDRLGIAVMAEIPVYWNFGWNWTLQNARGIHRQMFREMVLSSFNRPSVLLWGTENECPFVWVYKVRDYNAMLAQDHRDNYPDGRLITQSPAAQNWRLMSISEEPIDVAGWTMYYGVFYGKDMYADTKKFIQEHQQQFPELPIIDTEFGTGSQADDSDAQKQVDVVNGTWPALAEMGSLDAQGNVNPNGQLAATTWFTVFNWFTKNGLPNFIAPYLQSMGLMHMDRTTRKPVFDTLAAVYKPYADFGGLGPEPSDYVDDDVDDDAVDDDTVSDDDATDDDSSPAASDDDNANGCGC